ncbi:uncharacterized protein B0H18DRAFT_1143943 [Fomitopsis serialis]|uniref:uncharacterized protein n=1 Tax=Fomitopsis serialis TaxID=139415 RepID=UPI00200836EB|nr:uncharacterized protein B0H18DRAFT_1143943 [Neoantrodia serialis]KAH9914750.1 hypothetical protein B0H18DRAFT_1143943 [Neoantrodia serialis]
MVPVSLFCLPRLARRLHSSLSPFLCFFNMSSLNPAGVGPDEEPDVDEELDVDEASPGDDTLTIHWAHSKYWYRTDRLLDFLEANEGQRRQLFGEWSKESAAKGLNNVSRKTRHSQIHFEIAQYIFTHPDEHPKVRAAFEATKHSKMQTWTNRIGTRIRDLRGEYARVTSVDRGTGYGVSKRDREHGINSVKDKVHVKFPEEWVVRLAPMWGSAPTFVIPAQTSTPGQDLRASTRERLGLHQGAAGLVDTTVNEWTAGEAGPSDWMGGYGEWAADNSVQLAMSNTQASGSNNPGYVPYVTNQHADNATSYYGRQQPPPQTSYGNQAFPPTPSALLFDHRTASPLSGHPTPPGSETSSLRSFSSNVQPLYTIPSSPASSRGSLHASVPSASASSSSLPVTSTSSGVSTSSTLASRTSATRSKRASEKAPARAQPQAKKTRTSAAAARALATPNLDAADDMLDTAGETVSSDREYVNELKVQKERRKTARVEADLMDKRIRLLEMQKAQTEAQLKLLERTHQLQDLGYALPSSFPVSAPVAGTSRAASDYPATVRAPSRGHTHRSPITDRSIFIHPTNNSQGTSRAEDMNKGTPDDSEGKHDDGAHDEGAHIDDGAHSGDAHDNAVGVYNEGARIEGAHVQGVYNPSDAEGAHVSGTYGQGMYNSSGVDSAHVGGSHVGGSHVGGSHVGGAYRQLEGMYNFNLSDIEGGHVGATHVGGAHVGGAYGQAMYSPPDVEGGHVGATHVGARTSRARGHVGLRTSGRARRGAYGQAMYNPPDVDGAHAGAMHVGGAHVGATHVGGAHIEAVYGQGVYNPAHVQGAHTDNDMFDISVMMGLYGMPYEDTGAVQHEYGASNAASGSSYVGNMYDGGNPAGGHGVMGQ